MPDDAARPFRAVASDLGGAVEVSLHGELDLAGIAELWSSVAPVLQDPRRQGPLSLILDLTALEFLDAAGLGTVVRLASKIRGRGGEVMVRPPTRPLVRRVLDMADVATKRLPSSAPTDHPPPCGSVPAPAPAGSAFGQHR